MLCVVGRSLCGVFFLCRRSSSTLSWFAILLDELFEQPRLKRKTDAFRAKMGPVSHHVEVRNLDMATEMPSCPQNTRIFMNSDSL